MKAAAMAAGSAFQMWLEEMAEKVCPLSNRPKHLSHEAGNGIKNAVSG